MLGLAVISILALGLVLATRAGLREAHSDIETSEAQAFFDGVILQTAVSLLDTSQTNRLRIDGVPQTLNVLGQKIPITITSEFGKVDLNSADADSLTNLFEAAGEGPSEAAAEASDIVSWRSGGSGATNIRLFRIAAEITQVPGISDDLYNRVSGSVTVYSGRTRIDESTAPLLALQAMPGMDRLSAEAVIRDRANNQTSQQTGEVVNGQLAQGVSITGWAFQINSEFTLGPRHEHAEAVIRMTGHPARPYFTLWRQETPG